MKFDFLHDPELNALSHEILRLEEKRRVMIADKLLGRTRQVIGGITCVTDPTIPEGEIRLVDSKSGEIKAVLKNVA